MLLCVLKQQRVDNFSIGPIGGNGPIGCRPALDSRLTFSNVKMFAESRFMLSNIYDVRGEHIKLL